MIGKGSQVPPHRGDDELDYFHDMRGGMAIHGYVEAQLYPDDVSIATDEDVEAWRAEIRDRLARKRPMGFAPWPDDPPGELRRVA